MRTAKRRSAAVIISRTLPGNLLFLIASLARLPRDQRRSADALALLQPVYDRFTEGFDTADLKTAKGLLDALQ